MVSSLRPITHWGQSSQHVFVKVLVADCKEPRLDIQKREVSFIGSGVGAQGRNSASYEIHLELYSDINADESSCSWSERCITFKLLKEEAAEWPRLTADPAKRPWLRVDFDKLDVSESEDDDAEVRRQHYLEAMAGGGETNADNEDSASMWEEPDVEFRVIYLALYNILQSMGHFYIVGKLLFFLMYFGPDTRFEGYAIVGEKVCFCTGMALLEILNATLGITKSSASTVAMQMLGKNMLLFFVIAPETHVHTSFALWMLFLVWSLIECVRFPFYAMQLAMVDWYWLKYLRYTIWIPLYPFGFALEACVMTQALPHLKAAPRLSLSMPNAANVTFDFATFIQIYLVVFLFGAWSLLKHMWSQRCKVLRTKRGAKNAATKKTQ